MRKLERKPAKWGKIAANGRIDLGEEAELRALARSYIRCPIHPIIARHTAEVLDGNRRVRGLLLEGEGEREIEYILTDEDFKPEKLKEFGLLSAIHRKDLNDFEKAVAMRDIKLGHAGMTNKQLAEEILDLDQSMPTRFLSLFDRCIKPVQDAAAAGHLNASIWYAISQADPAQQLELLAQKLNGATREALQRAVKKQKNGTTSTVKVERLRCALPSGVMVQFSGEAISLEDALEAMKDLTAELKSAISQGLDSRTVVRVLADKAKILTRSGQKGKVNE